MTQGWKQWEGQVVNGEFPLLRFLGGSEQSCVFLVDKSAGDKPQTAIKFIPAASVNANEQLRQWKLASGLDHPNLIRVFQSGRCELGRTDFLYVLTEYGDENLSQIVPERALADQEARQVVDAVLKALAYLHDQNLVHGRIKPSNIFAVGDTVKLSSDSVRSTSEGQQSRREKSGYDPPEAAAGPLGPPGDVWSLGVTLVEVLGRSLPTLDSDRGRVLTLFEGIPEPFQEIARHCLEVDPGSRWTVAEIAACLESVKATARPQLLQKPGVTLPPGASSGKRSAKWPYALGLAAVAIVAAVLMLKPKPPVSSSEPQAVAPTVRHEESGTSAPSIRPQSSAAKPNPTTPGQAGSGSTASEELSTAAEGEPAGDVVRRVMPRVSPGARNTITGKIRVLVKADVDAEGNVTEARLESEGPSKYFARLALEAARGWKFKPALANGQPVASEWLVRFGFTRRGTEGSARRTAP